MTTTNTKPYGSIENPIRTDGVHWQVEYLHWLCAKSGSPFFFHRQGSVGTSHGEHLIDIYELIAHDNSERWVLAMSLYHSEMNSESPVGLELDFSRFRLPILTGVNTAIDNFPIGLLDEFQGEDCKAVHDYIKGILDKIPAEEWKTQKINNVLASLDYPESGPEDPSAPDQE